MYARVMTSSPKPGTAETAIAEWPQHIGAFKGKGLVTGYLFFDRAANQFLSITIWESEEAEAERYESRADPRSRGVHEAPHTCAGSEHLRSRRNGEVAGHSTSYASRPEVIPSVVIAYVCGGHGP